MNDKGHFIISVAKSAMRIIGCFACMIFVGRVEDYYNGIMVLAGSFLFAEILGILEEIVDKRK